jgi:hypothetical protein
MAKKKYPSELNSKVVRIDIGIYQLLTELATKYNLTLGEALNQLVTDRVKQENWLVPRAQIPMPAFIARSTLALSVNGDKHIAFVIRPKGGKIQ